MHAGMTGVITLLAFSSNFQPGNALAATSLDASWASVIAHDAIAGKQWGQETIFTYGPLGFLSPYLGYSPDTFSLQALGQGIFATLFALTVLYTARGLNIIRLCVLLCTFVFFFDHLSGDAAWLLSYCLSAYSIHTLLARDEKRFNSAAIAFFIITPSALVAAKASLAPVFAAWLLCIIGVCISHNKKYYILPIIFTSLCILVLPWAIFGQHAGAAFDYFRATMEIIHGYQLAMNFAPVSRLTDVLGLTTLALMLAAQLAWKNKEGPQKFLSLLFFIAILVSFKAAYIRADWAHLPIFTITAAIISILATGSPKETETLGKLAHAVPAIIIFAAYMYSPDTRISTPPIAAVTGTVRAAKMLFMPKAVEKESNNDYEKIKQSAALPAISRIVGNNTVDVFSYEQGVAYLNHLNLHHRPIFQSYSSYTPLLNEINKNFFERNNAPRWLIFKLQSIDNRLPLEDDALALPYVLTNYHPVLAEKSYLLLEQNETTHTCKPKFEVTQETRFGEWTDVPGNDTSTIWLRLNIEYSMLGRFQTLILRAPPLDIEIATADGWIRRTRLLPAVAQAGFVVSPALFSTQDWVDWLQGDRSKSVRAIRLLPGQHAMAGDFRLKAQVAFIQGDCHMGAQAIGR